MSRIEAHITYLQRSEETDDYGDRKRYQLHSEVERIASVPSFAELRDRFGRCEGKVYRDIGGEVVHCGYLFARRERWHDRSIGWNDPSQFYTAETWISFERVQVSPVDLSAER